MVMRFFGGILIAVIVAFVAIYLVGDRYGTRKPTPGRLNPEIVCDRFGQHCTTR
jgi:hypothetical protein